jgi:hypothetical protein
MRKLFVLCFAVLALSVWTIPSFAADAAPTTNAGTAVEETKEKKHEEWEAKKRAREEKREERRKAREERREKRKKAREEKKKAREERRAKRRAEKNAAGQQAAPVTAQATSTQQASSGQSGN